MYRQLVQFRPKLTVVVVKKRSNTRFFLKGNRNEFGNAPIGTVIDNTIVKNLKLTFIHYF